MSKNTKNNNEVEVLTKAELIAEYRKLGKSMTELRDAHIAEKEACIAKYKAAKEEIRKQREALLVEIRKPVEKVTKTETTVEAPAETDGPTDAELAEIEAEVA